VRMCFYSLARQRIILRALWLLLSGLPDDGRCDVPKHVADWLTSDGHILYI